MNIVRQQICDAAKTWLNTPYLHQQMVKGDKGGVDCAKFVAGVALDVGLITMDDIAKIPPYPRDWHIHNDVPVLTTVMTSFGCVKKKVLRPLPGDIVVFKIGRVPSHLGILLDDPEGHFIHAVSLPIGKVTITPLTGPWQERMVEVYKFPGV